MDRASLELVSQIADVAGAALWGGTKHEADYFNHRWLQYAGDSVEVWMSRGWEHAVHDEDRDRCTIALNETLKNRAIGDVEARLRNSGGEYRWHRIRFVLGTDRWFGLAFDLGERGHTDDPPSQGWARERAARCDAEQANRLKDRFFAAVSHELRAPIAALLLWERLLREHSLDPVETHRALDAIHHSAIAQARLVDDLLDVARINAGKLAVRLVPVDLAGVLESALEETRPAIAEKRQALETHITRDLGSVEGDATRLGQIVVNLLHNAIKFTPNGGTIWLSALRSDGQIIVEVADSGRGIAPEFLPQVFDMFSQIDDELDRGAAGLGLGLAIARELVILHGGTLTAHSDGIGTGARFTLRLPMTNRRADAAIERSNADALRNVCVLVVDDDHRVLSALQILLARAGARVQCATSVADAWQFLERGAPDVVVSDLAMPTADGYELVKRMRADSTFARVPAIALTAHAASADARKSLARGFDLHMSKPVDLEALVANIARLAHR